MWRRLHTSLHLKSFRNTLPQSTKICPSQCILTYLYYLFQVYKQVTDQATDDRYYRVRQDIEDEEARDYTRSYTGH